MNLLPQSDDEYPRDSEDYITSLIVFYLRPIGSPQKPEVGNEDDDVAVKARAHLLDSLYKNLDTLDNKANALLAVCGLRLRRLQS
jgi:hypothetical protein